MCELVFLRLHSRFCLWFWHIWNVYKGKPFQRWKLTPGNKKRLGLQILTQENKRGMYPFFVCAQICVLKDVHNCAALHLMTHRKVFFWFNSPSGLQPKNNPRPLSTNLHPHLHHLSGPGLRWREGTGKVKQRQISRPVFSKPGPWTRSVSHHLGI